MAFTSETGRTNLLSGGVTLSTVYQDNAYMDNADRISNVSYAVAPSISIQETRPRTLFTLNYAPGFTMNQRLSNRYDYAHHLFFNWQHRLTERLTVRVRDDFASDTNQYYRLNDNPLVPPPSVSQQPNNSIVTPLVRNTNNLADVELAYQLGAGSVTGASGSFYISQYGSPAHGTSMPLYDNQASSGNAYYSHRLSPSNWVGINGTFQRIISSGQISQATDNYAVTLSYTFAPSSRTSLQLFVGPDRAGTKEQYEFLGLIPILTSHYSYTVDGGLTFAWQGQRNSVRAQLNRRVTDGGGLTGAVQVYNATLDLRRQLTARWVGSLGVVYGNNHSLGEFQGISVQSISGTVGLQANLGEKVSANFGYARDHQNYQMLGASVPSPATIGDGNRGFFSISYHLTRPLGR